MIGGVDRGSRRVGNHRSDRFADVPHGISSQSPARRFSGRFAIRAGNRPHAAHRAYAIGRHVGAGKYRNHTRRGYRPVLLNAGYAGMGVR